jgi:hypothetical protein
LLKKTPWSPYLATFGVPSQYKGRDAIAVLFQFVRDRFPGLELENTKVLIDAPEQAFGNTSSPGCRAKPDDPFMRAMRAESDYEGLKLVDLPTSPANSPSRRRR